MVTALADAHLDGLDAVSVWRSYRDPLEQALFERVRLRAAERSAERRQDLAVRIANAMRGSNRRKGQRR